MKKRILFVIGSLDVGGAERHLVQILPLLLSFDYELKVFTITKKGKLSFKLENLGIQVIQPFLLSFISRFPEFIRKPLLFLFATLSYIFLMYKFRPFIVHFFLPTAYLFGGLLSFLHRPPCMVMSRRSLNGYQLKNPYLTKIEYMLHSRMNVILGNSISVIKDLLLEGIPSEKVGLIYNGVDFNYILSTKPKTVTRAQFNIDQNAFVIVCVANLIPYKGHKDLLEAINIIKNDLPGKWRLLLVGRDTGMKADLITYAETLQITSNILWLGERDDVADIYAASDIGVLCSHEEGFSNSLLEGMANGIPMIATDVGGNSEAIVSGESGIIVPSRSPDQIGNAILKLFSNPLLRKSISSNASLRVRDLFSINLCASKYEKVYSSLSIPSFVLNIQSVIDSSDKEFELN